MTDFKETAWNYVQGDATGIFYTAQRKWINKIHKWKEKYPDEVKIFQENPDGSITVSLPECWCKISPKKQSNMTQAQKDAAKDRLAKHRKKLQCKSDK